MPRLARRTCLFAALAALLAPGAARAATYSVSAGGGACGGADTVCGGLVEAAAAAAEGDVFNVAAGSYPAAKFDKGVTIRGATGVAINGTMQFSGGGASKLETVAVSQATANAPAVLVTGGGGVQLLNAVVVSVNGNGVHIAAGAANRIVRTLAVTGSGFADAVHVESTQGTPAKGVTLESSILHGGAAGLGVVTRNLATEAAAGDVNVVARHITAAGSTHGISLDSSNAAALLAPGVGNIVVTLTDSIALNNKTKRYALLGGQNQAVINADPQSILAGDPNALFVDPGRGNFRLRPGSPAIGRGGVTPGESPLDIDGEDRSTPPTDLGADEFYNQPPTARIVVATPNARAGRPVTFDGSASGDREAAVGGGIVQYRWAFTDGTTATTAAPTITHTFSTAGPAGASLIVIDRQGAASAPATVSLALTEGDAPSVGIVKPRANQTLSMFRTKTKTVTRRGKKRELRRRVRNRIQIAGLSRDASGVDQVVLTIEKLKGSSRSRCYWYDARRGFRLRSCNRPVLLYARLKRDSKNGEWTYNVPTRRPLSSGRYRVSAYGVDKGGVVGNSAPTRARAVRFTLER